ncbi:MAG: alpha/beta hydrolase, partial [FCB group bacterium]|nr:alpha/beta hydrolase [FCB group bacterium]
EASLQVPDRVRAIIGIDNFQDLTLKYYPAQVEAFLEPFKADFGATTKTFVANIVGPETDSAVRAFIVEDMSSAPPEIAMDTFRDLFSYDFAAALKELDIPVRTVSSTIRPTNVEKNRTLVPDFQVDFIEGVGHFPMLEKPEMFDRILARVIDEMTSETDTDK